MLPAPAALLASLALAGVTRYTASVSAVARYYTDLEVLEPIATSALELEPRLGLDLEEPTSLFGIAYYPRLVMIADSPPPQLFHQAALSLSFRPDPRLRLVGSATGCYGTNDFRVQYALACGAPTFAADLGAGPQPIPLVSTVTYMSVTGALGFEYRPSPSIAIAGTASYLVQGGADAPTRAVIPLQRGPSFLAALEWTVGRDDTLTTSFSGSYYAFLREALEAGAPLPASNAWIAQILELWQHSVGRWGRLRLGLGVGATGNAIDAAHLVLRTTSAIGEIGYRQALGAEEEARALMLNLSVRAAPFVDFTSGLAYQRAEAVAAVGWPIGPDWRLEGTLSGGVALDGVQRGQRTATALLAVTWTSSQRLRLWAGLNGLLQQAGANFPASTIRQAGFFLGATFSETGQL